MWGVRFGVLGVWFRVSDFGCGVSGLGFGVWGVKIRDEGEGSSVLKSRVVVLEFAMRVYR